MYRFGFGAYGFQFGVLGAGLWVSLSAGGPHTKDPTFNPSCAQIEMLQPNRLSVLVAVQGVELWGFRLCSLRSLRVGTA